MGPVNVFSFIQLSNFRQYLVSQELPNIDIVFFCPVCYNGVYGASGARKGARGYD